MEIHQPNEIYFQHHDHEARSKMMYPKINLYNGPLSMVFGKSSKINSSHMVGSTNVFSTSNEIGNELIRFAVLDNSQ